MVSVPVRKRFQIVSIGQLNYGIHLDFGNWTIESDDKLEDAKKRLSNLISTLSSSSSYSYAIIDFGEYTSDKGKIVHVEYPEYRLEKIDNKHLEK